MSLRNVFRSRLLISLRTVASGSGRRAISCQVLGNDFDDLEQRQPRFNHSLQLLRPQQLSIHQRRFKKGGRGAQKKGDESSDDEAGDSDSDVEVEDDLVPKGYTDLVINVNSLRLDTILKGGYKFSKAKIEEAFYDSRIRVNGYKAPKKSETMGSQDVIDFILGRNAENHEFLDVVRIEIKDVPDITSGTGRVKLPIRRYNKLTIQNYEEDAYEGSLLNITEKEQ